MTEPSTPALEASKDASAPALSPSRDADKPALDAADEAPALETGDSTDTEDGED